MRRKEPSNHLPIPEPSQELLEQARALARQAPAPACVDSVLCGTAGWTDPTLVRAGTFYPSQARSAAERLSYYASHFSLVEVDATFYATPAPSVSSRWTEVTAQAFVFDIKAPPVFTGHALERSRLPADLAAAIANLKPERQRLYPKDLPGEINEALRERFRLFLEPLQASGRLGCVMVQLPPWTTATRGAVRELEALSSLLPSVRLAVEFRHPSWLEETRRERVFSMLRSNGLAYVVVDEPAVPGAGVPTVAQATRDDLAVIRFHGRNSGGWRTGAGVLERFNYLYSPDQIAAFVPAVRELASQASQVHAVFNNCVRDYAVLNAKALAALLLGETKAMNDEVAPPSHPC